MCFFKNSCNHWLWLRDNLCKNCWLKFKFFRHWRLININRIFRLINCFRAILFLLLKNRLNGFAWLTKNLFLLNFFPRKGGVAGVLHWNECNLKWHIWIRILIKRRLWIWIFNHWNSHNGNWFFAHLLFALFDCVVAGNSYHFVKSQEKTSRFTCF